MGNNEETESSNAFIIIAGVVVLGLIGAFIFMKYMLSQSKIKLVEQANLRHQKIRDINNSTNVEAESVHSKMKKHMDNLGDSRTVINQIEMSN